MRVLDAIDNLPLEEQVEILKSMVGYGECIHSVFVADCNGCRERELSRALEALVDLHEKGFKTPTRGLCPTNPEDLWRFAKNILAKVDTTKTKSRVE